MARFDRYLLTQFMVLFGFFALVLVSVYWINRAVVLFDQLIADGQSARTFLTFTLLTLPNVIRMVLPIAAFASAVYVTNRLTNESELVVAQATGQSPYRLARPVVFFGLLVSLLMGVLVHFMVPSSRLELAEREQEIQANITARLLSEGKFLHPSKGITFYIREITPAGELRNVFLTDAREKGQRTTYVALKGYLVREESGPKLVMIDGQAQTLRLAEQRLSVTKFDNFTYDISELPTSSKRIKRDVRSYDTLTLFSPTPEALEATQKDAAVFQYEGHLRVVQPFTPLIAALIGFSALLLGNFSRFGVWRQIGLAIFLIVLIQVLENAAADVARRDAESWPVIYLPSLIGFIMIGVMLWLSAHPALFKRVPRQIPSGADTPGTPPVAAP